MIYFKQITIVFALTNLCGYFHPIIIDQIENEHQMEVGRQITPLQQLKSILKEKYVSEDGEKYKIELKPGLSDVEIESLAAQLPTGRLPADIRDLLKFASGFEFFGLDEVTFDGIGQFGFENLFPHSVQLAGDGFGNFWILDVDSKGNWGNVFYVCHDPAVIVKQSESLSEFIKHVHEFGKLGEKSLLDIIHERTAAAIWNDSKGGFIELTEAKKSIDTTLQNFAAQLPDNFIIADLRKSKHKAGFAWGKFGPDVERAVRYGDQLLWGFEKKKK